MTIQDGKKVKIHYKGTFEDGTVFDSSEGKDPLEFTIGSKQVIPGFENAVKEMKKGEEKEITITPENGYGQRNEDLVKKVPKAVFGEHPIKEGATVGLESKDGHKLAAVVKKIETDEVTLDMNHPLAGKTLKFKLTLVEAEE